MRHRTTPVSPPAPHEPGKLGPAAAISPAVLSGGGILPAVILGLAALAAYHNSFSVPLLFDDRASILDNPSIRRLWPLTGPLSPPREFGPTVSGRPLVNLSVALNYAISGTEVWSYHAFNMGTHILAGLALFGLVRRTLQRIGRGVAKSLKDSDVAAFGDAALQLHATPCAFVIALLWTLHPLQTESVTYIIQRSESMMGLVYLLTLYAFARSGDSPNPRRWQFLAVTACLTGMACKEVMVSAPVMVLFYDRTFIAGGFRAAWQARRGFYLCLAATWILLFALVASTGGNRGGTMGFDVGTEWISYWLTQFAAIAQYLRLSFWPHPLVFEYGAVVEHSLTDVWWQAIVVLALLGLTLWALIRKPRSGFLGVWFFAVLAPTSIVPAQMQTIAEHRVYLALAPMIVLVVAGGVAWLGGRALPVFFVAAAAAGFLTAQRNRAYASELSIWTDTVARRPANAPAHVNLGVALLAANRVPEAAWHFEQAVRRQPDSAVAHANLADVCFKLGQFESAREHGESAVRLDPGNVNARVNLGLALAALGRTDEAVPHYEEALRLQPMAADAHAHLAAALLELGRLAPAIEHYQAALRIDPDDAETWCDLARAFVRTDDRMAARRAAEQALRLKAGSPDALFVLGNLDTADGDLAAAITRYRRAVELAPDYVAARNNLANALLVSGRIDEAVAQYQHILRAQPDDWNVQENLRRALELQRAKSTGR